MNRFNFCSRVRLRFALIVACGGLAGAGLAMAGDGSGTNAAPYLAAVRQFAERILAHCRDVYGTSTGRVYDSADIYGKTR